MGRGIDESVPGFLGWVDTPAGRVARVAADWTPADRLGAWKVRWGIGRMRYTVPPGLYALGNPSPASPVVVTADYKLTWDLVRRALRGRDLWLLALETHGINVWCAGGKGTFGTRELVDRVDAVGLARVVSHRTLLLPLLSANGVRARDVKAHCGFEARFATIRASDLPEYLDNGFRTTDAMRRMTFTLGERMALAPVEWLQGLRSAAPALAACAGAGILAERAPLSLPAFGPALAVLAAVCLGTVGVPLLLPWLPGRGLSMKGAALGLLPALAAGALSGWAARTFLPALLVLPAVTAYYALKFTGSTPYTSQSGVKAEIRRALAPMAAAAMSGALTWIVSRLGVAG